VTRPTSLRRLPSPGLLLALILPSSLAAQHVLLVDDGGKFALVRAATGTSPCVEKEGKVVPTNGYKFALKEVPEFLPVFVTVRNVNVRTTYLTSTHQGGQFNNDFHFDAEFETGYHLKDVFVVLAMDTEQGGRALFLWEVGELVPKKGRNVHIIVPMDSAIGSSRYTFHLFSGGAEVLQSLVSFGDREVALNRMVAARIKDVQEAGPKLFMGLGPEYPPALRKQNTKGQAVITVRIGANGAVFDPVVKSATDPAFGEAALAAVKLWRFLPMVKNGYPVETKADVPVVFTPPGPQADTT
jgi:TonB family protein